jgi:hypothetical protein
MLFAKILSQYSEIDMNKNGFTALMIALAACAALGVSGCGKQVSVSPSDPICLSLVGKTEMMETAQQILVKKKFIIEKYDIDAGYILTRPMRGSQFFEPWRGDTVGAANKAASNIHSIERVITMNFTQDTGQLCVECIVDSRRLSMPEKQLIANSQAAAVFVGGGTSGLELKPDTEEDIAWIDLGRDGALERDILERIKLKTTEVK